MSDILLRDATPRELANAVEDNLNALFRAMMALPGGEMVERSDVSFHHAFPLNPMFNGVWATCLTDENADRVIDETVAWFKQRNTPLVFWWVTNRSQPADLAAKLAAHGFQLYDEGDPGMAVELAALNEQIPAPDGFQVVRVETDAQVQQWADTFVAAFEIPPAFAKIAGQSWADATLALGVDKAPWQMYLGYLDGKPVATNMLFLGAGVGSVFAVGTIPEARGQGIGAMITLKPFLDAREMGYRYGVLFSTEMGHPVYERLGFRDVDSRIGRYLWRNE
jgi:GNAT superfamily N-acetyltransferase